VNGLVDKGNTVIVIEHNLDVIKTADHIIDMGPEGGSGGGLVIAEGTPEEVAANPASYTGQFLAGVLEGRGANAAALASAGAAVRTREKPAAPTKAATGKKSLSPAKASPGAKAGPATNSVNGRAPVRSSGAKGANGTSSTNGANGSRTSAPIVVSTIAAPVVTADMAEARAAAAKARRRATKLR